ncbi:hypothetical protein GCM10011379_40090 [Filimonas zeae]|uniref:Beta-xylanase n=2 Tax=Filimonas zeae TaxID=1737353 RepID=A0A917MXT4_9BACT|nr:hypothetical protein GCM10011379_40090 [Filimonas zeae]
MKDAGILNTGNYSDSSAALKEATDITMGAAIDYTPMTTDAKYAAVVKRDYDGVTFGYHMKHGAVVQANGTLDFTRPDALLAACSGLAVFGHTLGWHSNQNADYLKSYSGLQKPAVAELLGAPGFESGLTGWSVFNTGNPSGTATVTATTVANEVHGGTGAMKVVNPTAYTGNQWRVQVSSASFATVSGKDYVITYWVKAANAGGSIRLSLGTAPATGSSQYQGDQTIGTSWQQISFSFRANSSTNTFLFDMGQVANTYYIDDASVKEVVPTTNLTQVALKLDTALNKFITGMVTHYKGTVKAWDVVNEVLSPSGAYRNAVNSTDADPNAKDLFIWEEYMGRDFVLKAFNYAKAADPSALLFINEYGIESSTPKLDSLIALVTEMKGKGAKIDGIGTQLHIAWNTSYAGIDAMMQKLAATGLLIRISELDVKINPSAKPGFILTPTEASYQAAMYKYVIDSYKKYIPKAQQHGITIWGVTDNTSWLYNNGRDYPLLYNADYSKKPAYGAVLQGLRTQ